MKPTPQNIFSGAAAFLTLIIVLSSFVIVDAGYVGVVKRLGAVQPDYLPEGFHIKTPFIEGIQEFDVRLAKVQTIAGASSRDLQVITTEIAVQYSMIAELTPMTLQKIGTRKIVERTLIEPAIMESVKAITALYTAEQLITQREEVKNKIQDRINSFLNETLKEKQLMGALAIANVAITDFDFSEEFNRAIEDKVRAEQEALKAKTRNCAESLRQRQLPPKKPLLRMLKPMRSRLNPRLEPMQSS